MRILKVSKNRMSCVIVSDNLEVHFERQNGKIKETGRFSNSHELNDWKFLNLSDFKYMKMLKMAYAVLRDRGGIK